MTISGTNFGKAAADYGTYRVGFPESLFDRLAAFDVGLHGQTVIDLGTGTGTLARRFAIRGCKVIGLDPDPRMIAQAKDLDRAKHVSIEYVEAKAEATGLRSRDADVVIAGQCWHWFDRPLAIAEALRVLKPDGKLVIAHFDWLPLPENVVAATERLIRQHNPNWHIAYGGVDGMYPHWLPDLSAAGLKDLQTFSYDVDVPYTPEAWRGRIRASAGIVALDARATSEFDAALAQLLAAQFPASVLAVPHRVFAIVSAKTD